MNIHEARIDIDATAGTPAIAYVIGEILKAHGADVVYADKRAEGRTLKIGKRSLSGLRVKIDRLTWVRDEEAERWHK